jgi:hypothetical protein
MPVIDADVLRTLSRSGFLPPQVCDAGTASDIVMPALRNGPLKTCSRSIGA